MGKSRPMPLHAPTTAAPGPANYHAQRASDEHAAGPAFSMPRAPRLRAPATEIIGPGRYDVIPSASASAFSRSPRRLSPVASCPYRVVRADASGDAARLFRCCCALSFARPPLAYCLSLVVSPPHIVRPSA